MDGQRDGPGITDKDANWDMMEVVKVSSWIRQLKKMI